MKRARRSFLKAIAFVGGFFASVGAWGDNVEGGESKPEIVQWLEEARDIHQEWARRLRDEAPFIVYGKHTIDEVEFTKRAARLILGPPEYHEEWAARYDKILASIERG